MQILHVCKESLNLRFEYDVWEYLQHVISTSTIHSLFSGEQREGAVNYLEAAVDAVQFGMGSE